MKIRFVQDYIVKDEVRTAYREGQEIECSTESALHFLSRGRAVVVPQSVDVPSVDVPSPEEDVIEIPVKNRKLK